MTAHEYLELLSTTNRNVPKTNTYINLSKSLPITPQKSKYSHLSNTPFRPSRHESISLIQHDAVKIFLLSKPARQAIFVHAWKKNIEINNFNRH